MMCLRFLYMSLDPRVRVFSLGVELLDHRLYICSISLTIPFAEAVGPECVPMRGRELPGPLHPC